MRRKAIRLAFTFIILLAGLAYGEEQTVEIQSAQTTEYSKRDDGGEVVTFGGAVTIVVTKGDSVSTIRADRIVYDKTSDTLSAVGNISYVHTSGKSGSESFNGAALLFDLTRQEGEFSDGTVIRDAGKKDADPYIIHSDLTGKDSSSTIAFRDGVLTTCDEEDPHWFIKASRIWLLPGNELALLNGLFYIGPLPVFYIPFFYYPSDEMIFHPVFGFRNREGYFVQTTTYLHGRKPLPTVDDGEGTSFANFLQGDTLKEQKRQGLFLENLPEDAKKVDDDYLKLMVDAYSSLGAMVGLDGSFDGESAVQSVDFSTYFGVSRTLYPPSSGVSYSTYDDTGDEHFNSGWAFGHEFPFRFKTTFTAKLSQDEGQLSVSLPLISDPSFKPDFLDRSEDLNWLQLLTDQSSLALGSDLSDETSYSWNVTGSYAPNLEFASPYLEKASITSASAILTFNSKTNSSLSSSSLESTYSPENEFFYPEIFKPTVTLSFGGTLYSSDAEPEKTKPAADTSGLANPYEDSLEKNDDGLSAADTARFFPDVASGDAAPTFPSWVFDLTWSLDPSIAQEYRFAASDWDSPDEIAWDEYASTYYKTTTTAKVTGAWAFDTDRITVSSALVWTGTKQDHPWLSPSVYTTDSSINTVKASDYEATDFSFSTVDAAKYKPFNRVDLLKPMSIGWDFDGDFVKSEYDGDVDSPAWDVTAFQWDKDYVTTHAATAVAGLAFGDNVESLTLVSDLPPLTQSYAGTAGFAWDFAKLALSTKLYEDEDNQNAWTWDPFKETLTLTFPHSISFSQSYTYDIEDEEPTRLGFTGAVGPLSGYYTMANTYGYKFYENDGWKRTSESFQPTVTGITFNNSSSPLKLYSWKNRIALQAQLKTNLEFNLLKITESSFYFTPALTLKINEFFDVSFSSNSTNEVVARYFQQWVDLPVTLPGERNVLRDLMNSFAFNDDAARRSSGFKLKTMSVTATHYLHDWTAKLKTTIEPELNADTHKYEFLPTISFSVQWNPISDIKTKVKSENGVFSLNATDDDEDDDE